MKAAIFTTLVFTFSTLAHAAPARAFLNFPRKALTEAFSTMNQIREQEKASQFRKTGIDTKPLLNSSQKVLSERYMFPIQEDQVRSKVLAIEFLRWTQHWQGTQECIDTLNSVIRLSKDKGQFQNSQIRLNVLSDVGDLAGICSKLNPQEFRKTFEQMPAGLLKDQVALGARIVPNTPNHETSKLKNKEN